MGPRRLIPCVIAASLLGCADDTATATGDTDASSDATDTESGGATETDTGETGDTEDGFDPYPWPDEALSVLVDPMIGTGGVGYTVGTMNPGPSLPFGMIKPGPDTGLGPVQLSFLNCTGYHYDQPHIWGFSHSRINGMGVPDYGAVQVVPAVGIDPDMTVIGGARSLYDHAEEQAAAGYYAVELLDHGVFAELTATTRATRHRYTWDQPSAEASILFNLGYNPGSATSTASEIEIDPAGGVIRGMMTVYGSYSDRFGGVPTYFAARVSQPIAGHGVWDDMGGLSPELASMTGAQIGGWLRFDLSGADEPVVELELAISYVSIAEAEANLAELDGQSFAQTRAAAEASWDAELARVRVLGGSEEQRELFYSALYRSFLAPTIFTEASGRYRGFDDAVHDTEDRAADFTYYTDFSLWDTYRTVHPLFNLIQRERHADMLESLATIAAQGGDLPKWPLGIGYTGGMVGTSADIVLADAYLKDITDFDVETAYAAARLHAIEPRPNAGRAGIVGYRERGWVASDETGASASRTLEFAHADYALGRWAAALGESEDAALFEASGHNWQHLWAPELEFLIGRRADGSFELDGFDPLVWESYYSEGTANHYLWAAPHDVATLAELMGGIEPARERLAAYFETSAAFMNGGGYNPLMPVPYYWQSNEPSLHDAYLFTELGDPASTQRWVDWARERYYGLGPKGLPGNDDAGTMSAWYVFASIGLYPLPGSDGYWITAPIFERVELDLSDAQHPDRRLAVIADGAGPEMIYVAGAAFNGDALERPWITWQQLREEGGTLRLTLADAPSDFGAF
ncbi:GH92 family glycosyl hydrolase [Enhygromyxa salina]|uniref:Glycosyl hydrolase family 92 n=1 Tax=Enhygromyxa salina TaxID=215803 RepID=A0A2S9YRA2_9BACT|nr:GH92 family glycosyl hydrolase [Enhygromyxa salina]PRQ07608.1 Glycosyl hydrolase family 92 [Enhygromyxa salina]